MMAEDEEKKMDGDIVRWAMEFVVRESNNSSVVKGLIANVDLPLPADDSRTKKAVVLCSFQNEIRKGSVSEEMLEWFEIMEQLDRLDGIPVSETMKLAYCAVAVECTVREKFIDAVDRIWKVRFGGLEGRSELVTGEVEKIRDYVETALMDLNRCLVVLQWRDAHDALKSVEEYLKEAMVAMGPSFLELVAGKQLEMECGENSDMVGEAVYGEEPIRDGGRLENEETLERKDSKGETGEGSKGGVDGTENEKEEHPCENVGDGDKGKGEDVLKRKDGGSDKVGEGSNGGVDGKGNGEDGLSENVRDGAEGTHGEDGENVQEGEGTLKMKKRKDRVAEKIGEDGVKRKKRKGAAGKPMRYARRSAPAKIADLGEADEIVDPTVGNQDGNNVVVPPNQNPTGLTSEAGIAAANEQPVLDKQKGKEIDAQPIHPETCLEPDSGNATEQKGKEIDAQPIQPETCLEPDSENATANEQHVLDKQKGKEIDAQPTQPEASLEPDLGNATANEEPVVETQTGKETVNPEPGTTAEKNNAASSTNAAAADVLPPASPPKNKPAGRVLPPGSPPKKPIDTSLLQRRKKRKWSEEEEKALYNGVQQFGAGSWKEILSSRRQSFNNRTEVDLKDKWRNMSRWKRGC